MKKLLILLLCVPLIGIGQICNFSADSKSLEIPCLDNLLNIYDNDIKAINAIEKIIFQSGLSNEFNLIKCENIPNAAAVIGPNTGNRYILYNSNFMRNISYDAAGWSYVSILAHEIGHHIEGHTLRNRENYTESHKFELEADEFSGFIMYRLGATLQQAQQAVNIFSSNYDDTYQTHPNLDRRLKAIEKGYNFAMKNKNKKIKKTTPNMKNLGWSDGYDGCYYGDCKNGNGKYMKEFIDYDYGTSGYNWEGKFNNGWLVNGTIFHTVANASPMISVRGKRIPVSWGSYKLNNSFLKGSLPNINNRSTTINDWKPGVTKSIILDGYGCITGYNDWGDILEMWDYKKIGIFKNNELIEGTISSHHETYIRSGKFIDGKLLNGEGVMIKEFGNDNSSPHKYYYSDYDITVEHPGSYSKVGNTFILKFVGEFKNGSFIKGRIYDMNTNKDITSDIKTDYKYSEFRYIDGNYLLDYLIMSKDCDFCPRPWHKKSVERFLNFSESKFKELYNKLKYKKTNGKYSEYTNVSFEEFVKNISKYNYKRLEFFDKISN